MTWILTAHTLSHCWNEVMVGYSILLLCSSSFPAIGASMAFTSSALGIPTPAPLKWLKVVHHLSLVGYSKYLSNTVFKHPWSWCLWLSGGACFMMLSKFVCVVFLSCEIYPAAECRLRAKVWLRSHFYFSDALFYFRIVNFIIWIGLWNPRGMSLFHTKCWKYELSVYILKRI